MLVHKGFIGQIEYDMASGQIVGEVINAPDVILFQGETAEAVKQSFESSVDDYLAFMAQIQGASNIINFSPPLSLHLPPNQHNEVICAARAADKSINEWCSEVLQVATRKSMI